jgi:hypothetical protein
VCVERVEVVCLEVAVVKSEGGVLDVDYEGLLSMMLQITRLGNSFCKDCLSNRCLRTPVPETSFAVAIAMLSVRRQSIPPKRGVRTRDGEGTSTSLFVKNSGWHTAPNISANI